MRPYPYPAPTISVKKLLQKPAPYSDNIAARKYLTEKEVRCASIFQVLYM